MTDTAQPSSAPDAEPVGTFKCPICMIGDPHAHGIYDIVDWLQAQASRFLPDWKKTLVIRAGNEEREESETVRYLKQQVEGYEENVRHRRYENYCETPAADALAAQSKRIAELEGKVREQFQMNLEQHGIVTKQAERIAALESELTYFEKKTRRAVLEEVIRTLWLTAIRETDKERQGARDKARLALVEAVRESLKETP